METNQEVACSSEGTKHKNVFKGKKMERVMDCNVGAEKEASGIPKHPYADQLAKFQPNSWQWQEQEPQMYFPVDETALTMVGSQQRLDEMMSKLKEVKELVIDLEHHSYRSFKGVVCLVQISTRMEDFIVDALLLKEELHILNDICTDPDVLKIFHGSERDICWLQRDFGVFVVNMFDTQQAARMLHEEGVSLAHLLKKYCDVNVNKQYQLADWRIRPLPEDMIKYAREDTHYLLYIYDIFRNAMLQGAKGKTLLKDVYVKSTSLCAMLHAETVFQPDSYLAAYKKVKGKLNPQQLECFRLLFQWRDRIARQEDESTGYTLPNKMMFQIAQTLPSDPQGVILCCIPLPPLVHTHVEDIHRLVVEAIQNVPYVPEEEDKEQPVGSKKREVEKKGESNYARTEEEERQSAIKSPKSKKRQGNNKNACFECGEPGHRARDCRKRRERAAISREPSASPHGRHPQFSYNRPRLNEVNSYVTNYYSMAPYFVDPHGNTLQRYPFGNNLVPAMGPPMNRINPYLQGAGNPYIQGGNLDNQGMIHYIQDQDSYNQATMPYNIEVANAYSPEFYPSNEDRNRYGAPHT